MRTVKLLLILLLIIWPLLATEAFAEESITITTYYPSPYGSYREMRAMRMAIGDDYIQGEQYCWEGELGCTGFFGQNVIPSATDLVVQGNVGIGTAGPGAKLDVRGAIYDPSNPSLTISPTGNPPSTLSTLAIQGTTTGGSREFLAHFGLTSNRAGGDKVALYAATVGQAGTSDIWGLNSVTTISEGSGSYHAQGYELDFNNLNAHRGDTPLGVGLAAPVAYGLSITGAGNFRSTSAMLISGPGPAIWNRGITIANSSISQASFQDLGTAATSLDIQGTHTYGIYVADPGAKNYFAGNVGIGTVSPTLGPLQMGSGAYVTSGGVWTDASSRIYKQDIAPLGLDKAMKTLTGLQPVTFRYKRAPDEQHVGFISEDVPELVATKDRSGLSAMDIVAVLTKVVQDQQKELDNLKAELKHLKRKL